MNLNQMCITPYECTDKRYIHTNSTIMVHVSNLLKMKIYKIIAVNGLSIDT